MDADGDEGPPGIDPQPPLALPIMVDSLRKKRYGGRHYPGDPTMLRALLFMFVFYPLTMLLAIAAIVGTLFDRTARSYHFFATTWSRIALGLSGVRVRAEGLDKVPVDVPVIFMSNHQGNFDIFALYLAVPRRFAWLAKEELFKIPVFGHSMSRAGYIPIQRGEGRSALKAMAYAAERIRAGASVMIFPEGTRTPDGHLLPFKKGGFVLAARAGVPIVPVTLNGSRRINPKERLALYPGEITVRFSEPIPAAEVTAVRREVLMEKVRMAINANLEA